MRSIIQRPNENEIRRAFVSLQFQISPLTTNYPNEYWTAFHFFLEIPSQAEGDASIENHRSISKSRARSAKSLQGRYKEIPREIKITYIQSPEQKQPLSQTPSSSCEEWWRQPWIEAVVDTLNRAFRCKRFSL